MSLRPVFAALMLLVACSRAGDGDAARRAPARTSRALIIDQAHNQGTRGFFWLPPIAQSAVEGPLDGTQSPEVHIDELDADRRPSVRMAIYTMATGPGSERVRVGVDGYIVNWHTDQFSLDQGRIYRLSVVLGGRTLGVADVQPVSSAAQVKNVDTQRFIALVDGRTLPIKFFLNRCAPVVCSALDSCHDVGLCDVASGVCSSPAKPDGALCNDGNLCTRGDVCQAGACVAGPPVSCPPPPGCTQGGTCDPATGICGEAPACGSCGNGNTDAGEDCDDGNVVAGDGCSSACRFEGCGNQLIDPLPPPTAVRLAWAASGCSGNSVDIVFHLNGSEVARAPVSQNCACDRIPVAERLLTDPAVLALFRQAPPNSMTVGFAGGTACSQMLGWAKATVTSNGTDTETAIFESNPGDAARRQSFYCDEDGNSWVRSPCQPVSAALTVQLHEECDDGNRTAGDGCSPICNVEVCGNGRIDAAEGCDDGNVHDGDACTNRCTINHCYDVYCAGTPCEVATCNPDNGQCTIVPIPEGGACNDFDLCTRQDFCRSGECVGTNPVVCEGAPDSCHEAGQCLLFTGECWFPAKPNGTVCDDANQCTFGDVCSYGSCTGGQPITCPPAPDDCHASVCEPTRGCAVVPQPDGTTCTDDNACTRSDTCQAGTCQGADPVVCTSSVPCHDAECDPATGACFDTNKPDYTTCSDGNACTQTDTCLGGSCVGRNPVICDAPNDCHQAGTCNPTTGQCSAALPASDGNACEDGNACTTGDRCVAGRCTAGGPVSCPPVAGCRITPICHAASGRCGEPKGCTACGDGTKAIDEQCDDGNETDGDGCSAACVREYCGDGQLSWLPPRSLELHWLGSTCEGAGELTLRLNGSPVFRGPVGPAACGCTPPVTSVTVDDATVLRAFRDGRNTLELDVQGAARLSWAAVRLSGVDTVEVPLFDAGGGHDAIARRANLCTAGTQTGALNATASVRFTLYEDCDDGNTVGGDGCSATCANESNRRPPCGDGRIGGGEQCDDGNTQSGDGCSPTCQREP